jgi:hypothetical protein
MRYLLLFLFACSALMAEHSSDTNSSSSLPVDESKKEGTMGRSFPLHP